MPAVVAASGPEVANRFLEFFLVAIRNLNTRRAYAAAVRAFCAWLQRHGARDLAAVERFCQIRAIFRPLYQMLSPLMGKTTTSRLSGHFGAKADRTRGRPRAAALRGGLHGTVRRCGLHRNTVHFTILTAAAKSMRVVGCGARGRSW